jgi:hypothetical protein
MGNVSWKGGSQEVNKFTAIAQLKMEDACSFYNMIDFFCWRKVTKTKKKRKGI